MALSSNSIIPITKHRHDPRMVAVPPLWVDRHRVEPRASKSATDATAGSGGHIGTMSVPAGLQFGVQTFETDGLSRLNALAPPNHGMS